MPCTFRICCWHQRCSFQSFNVCCRRRGKSVRTNGWMTSNRQEEKKNHKNASLNVEFPGIRNIELINFRLYFLCWNFALKFTSRIFHVRVIKVMLRTIARSAHRKASNVSLSPFFFFEFPMFSPVFLLNSNPINLAQTRAFDQHSSKSHISGNEVSSESVSMQSTMSHTLSQSLV